jgi:predicted metalloprotease
MRMAGPVGGVGVVLAIVVALLTGVNPLDLIQQQEGSPVAPGAGGPPENDPRRDFVAAVLGSTEDVWGGLFRNSGRQYQAPSLVLFDRITQSSCGLGQAAMGPFYCPADQQVYLDLSFFAELEARLGAPGDFAQAYVIAHEVGHHVQTLLDAPGMRPGSGGRSNEVSVRIELQADCYAGVWAHHVELGQRVLEPGDLEEALNAASAIGDDRLQQQSQGVVVPESFTHGTSAQRVAWFRRGFDQGNPAACDTFARGG